MNLIFLFIISFSLIINPTIAYSKSFKSIKDKTKFYEIINCYPDDNLFNEFSECIDNQTMTSQKLGLLKDKKKQEIFDLIAIANIINESVSYGFVDNNTAFNNWNKFINSNYKKRISKQKLKKILDESKCENSENYESFINCFNDEFRSYDIYQSADIKTKERMEHIVFNSLILTNPDGLVYTLKKENIYIDELDKLYEHGDGYDFFFTLINALGTNYFKKKESDIDYKKIIKFIVIAIVVAYLAKSLLKSSGGSTASSSTSSSTSAASSSSTASSYSLSYSGSAAKGAFGKGMFRYAPKTSVLQKPWFKYTFARGGFF